MYFLSLKMRVKMVSINIKSGIMNVVFLAISLKYFGRFAQVMYTLTQF